MSDESFEAIGCLAALVTAVVVVPIYLSAFIYSAPTTIALTIFAATVAKYTWPDRKHWLISSDRRNNNYTSTRKAEKPSQEEVEETKNSFLVNQILTASLPTATVSQLKIQLKFISED